MVAGRHPESLISTERLDLRPWLAEEAERLLDMRSRPDVAKWLGSPEPWTELDAALEKIAEWEERTGADDLLGVWAIAPRDRDEPVGTVNLGKLPDSDEVHIGWVLHPDAYGNGYASEAAKAVLDYAIAEGVPRVWAIMWPENGPSAKVARAIGMDDLGVLDDPWFGTTDFPQSQMFRRDAPTC